MSARDNDLLASLDYEDDDNDPDYVDEEQEDVVMDDDDDPEQHADPDDDDDAENEPTTISLAELLQTASAASPSGQVSGMGLLEMLRIARSLGFSMQVTDTGSTGRRARNRSPSPPPETFAAFSEPQQAGVELQRSGQFGSVKALNNKPSVARTLRARESALRPSHIRKEELARPLVPNSQGTVVATFDDNVYAGQYSEDGNFFYTCCRDFRLDIFSTTHMNEPQTTRWRRGGPVPQSTSEATMRNVGTIRGHGDGWTVTDSHLSPDNERLIYASMSSCVYLTRTGLPDSLASPHQTPIRFRSSRWTRGREYDEDVQIWSCRFSADGNEIVAGGSSHIFVYDLVADRQTVNIPAHGYDINSCCWADRESGNVLISSSDDTFLKVWDRRSLGTGAKPSGVLIGHVEGITYVSPKGDGRYIISNGKDQTLRLWDLRMMRTHKDYLDCKSDNYGDRNFDYRYGILPRLRQKSHPMDCSVMHYRGHEVLRTLIRCHFSPAETTGQNYIYSGGSNGQIHIWSLDGTVVQTIDRSRTLPISFDPTGPDPGEEIPRERPAAGRMGQRTTGIIVRDLSWHPSQPVLLSSAWRGESTRSNVARHEWKGLTKHAATMRKGALEDLVERQQWELPDRNRKRRRVRVPGEYFEMSESE
ncbi:WD40 repeat-like protein [Exidia glandulosa HHB12029]|uniref:WD40 repeat-like protein n=1 Tax=Exidia glandulosa HHB12029 TaxID=1314781 RepID=A0A165JAM0_EXIGL|nr:WD40 repeat-like protein [Exidia glandulosa HHB12029]